MKNRSKLTADTASGSAQLAIASQITKLATSEKLEKSAATAGPQTLNNSSLKLVGGAIIVLTILLAMNGLFYLYLLSCPRELSILYSSWKLIVDWQSS